jgi:hypothetical protein
VHQFERLDVGDRAIQRDAVFGGAGSLDRHKARAIVATVRLHDEMRDPARDRVDDDIGEFAERRVRTTHHAAELKSHASIEPPPPAALITHSG